eukprot:CAMPEP_0206220462 /NCGR_PEP_ID=MMETSP0047_2-20121206/4890_1 /ASSEMBLY_ACC=CAM_ASM_000192 /TAXON_ID=195065 /ORGANISM="Chroomonas mesostigmatica_cf, Strain CCMP1168" /LENGTH=206 /DNA_ID=CAMNT_0053643123 /DNA_START=41 /DNA_END=658 /DNA_ORIENTATION=-
MDFFEKMGFKQPPAPSADLDLPSFDFEEAVGSAVGCAATEPGLSGGQVKDNHDRTLVVTNVYEGVSLFAVLDGHGKYGKEVVELVLDALPRHVKNALYNLEEGTLVVRFSKVFEALEKELTFTLGDAVAESGCTATVVLQKGDRFLVGHLGDSRAVLGGAKGRCQPITVDHNPASPGERARIEGAGGVVAALPGEESVEESGSGSE